MADNPPMTQAEESDLVERLNYWSSQRDDEDRLQSVPSNAHGLLREAAAEIARLRKEVDNLTRVSRSCKENEDFAHERAMASRAAIEALVGAAEKAEKRLICSQGRGSEDPDVTCYCPNCDRSLRDVRDALSRAVEDARRGNDIAKDIP